MLDRRILRESPEVLKEALAHRGYEFDVDALVELDRRRRELIERGQALREQRNALSKQVGQVLREGGNADELRVQVGELKRELERIEAEEKAAAEEFDRLWVQIPNIPLPAVPVGASEEDNVVIHERGQRRTFSFDPQPHWEVGPRLGLINWEVATKIAGSRFVADIGLGARLERSLINFMLDTHTRKHGYTEVLPPFLANERSMFDCGMLPKFEEDMFKTREGYYLVPTAEVPLTNLHQDEILDADELPKYYTAYTPCFRAEAGAAGQESRGLIRQHQFHKVELMKFVKPGQGDEELEKLTQNAEAILDALELPYRRVALCTADLGFASAQTFDLEVWMPGMNKWVEISSCSQYGDFQARRANTRFRPEPKAKPVFVHTMNGSGLAAGRTLAAILENYQNEDGTVTVPEVLRPYMGGEAVLYPPGVKE
ncbi:MAG: serine--tRNA ligase [Armatimonadetes bacterium]|nr:serine--tRNA ligase [Armatimonadota bacterium]